VELHDHPFQWEIILAPSLSSPSFVTIGVKNFGRSSALHVRLAWQAAQSYLGFQPDYSKLDSSAASGEANMDLPAGFDRQLTLEVGGFPEIPLGTDAKVLFGPLRFVYGVTAYTDEASGVEQRHHWCFVASDRFDADADKRETHTAKGAQEFTLIKPVSVLLYHPCSERKDITPN
jgi:hypothetical protein